MRGRRLTQELRDPKDRVVLQDKPTLEERFRGAG